MLNLTTGKIQSESPLPTVKEHTLKIKGMGEFNLREDKTLLEGLQSAGMEISAPCGGLGKCRKCTATVLEGTVNEVGPDSVAREYIISSDAPRDVLSCRTTPLSDLTVELKRRSSAKIEGLGGLVSEIEVDPLLYKIALVIPESENTLTSLDRLNEALGFRVNIDAEVLRQLTSIMSEREDFTVSIAELPESAEIVRVEPGRAVDNHVGIAIDIGTTTVACALLDLTDGTLIAESSLYNRQMNMGADVATRISHGSDKDGLKDLQEAVVETINTLIKHASGTGAVEPSDIGCMVISGNTTMMHLLHGLNPWGLGQYPFTPVTNEPPPVRAKTLGININPDGYIYSTPSISAYIGGDITSDLLASGILEKEERSLLIDLGTNGEMVLSDGNRVVTASCATGPAFEGASCRFGMNGIAGAIERYSIDPETGEASFVVIGGGLPEGVCGSGIIDILAEIKRNGTVTERGRLIEGSSPYVRRDADGKLEYLVATGTRGDITLNDKEISELLVAKAAMTAGIQICLNNMQLSVGDLDRILVAGGFGKHIDLDNAVEIGLLPDGDRGKYKFIGNGSLKGAVLELLNKHQYVQTRSIARQKVENIQLEQDPRFEDTFYDSMKLG